MTLEKFRIIHSTLIEQYQYIEFNLEGIYAAVSGKDFVSGLEDVETSNIGKLILEIKKIEAQDNTTIISVELYNRIEQARIRRNFWCHNCYVDMLFNGKGDPKKEEDIRTLMNDLREAEDLRNVLQEIKLPLMRNNPPKLF